MHRGRQTKLVHSLYFAANDELVQSAHNTQRLHSLPLSWNDDDTARHDILATFVMPRWRHTAHHDILATFVMHATMTTQPTMIYSLLLSCMPRWPHSPPWYTHYFCHACHDDHTQPTMIYSLLLSCHDDHTAHHDILTTFVMPRWRHTAHHDILTTFVMLRWPHTAHHDILATFVMHATMTTQPTMIYSLLLSCHDDDTAHHDILTTFVMPRWRHSPSWYTNYFWPCQSIVVYSQVIVNGWQSLITIHYWRVLAFWCCWHLYHTNTYRNAYVPSASPLTKYWHDNAVPAPV